MTRPLPKLASRSFWNYLGGSSRQTSDRQMAKSKRSSTCAEAPGEGGHQSHSAAGQFTTRHKTWLVPINSFQPLEPPTTRVAMIWPNLFRPSRLIVTRQVAQTCSHTVRNFYAELHELDEAEVEWIFLYQGISSNKGVLHTRGMKPWLFACYV